MKGTPRKKAGSKPPAIDLDREVWRMGEACEFFGLSRKTIADKAEAGEIPGRKLGRFWLFSRDECRALFHTPAQQQAESSA